MQRRTREDEEGEEGMAENIKKKGVRMKGKQEEDVCRGRRGRRKEGQEK